MPWKRRKLNPIRFRVPGGWACVLLNLLICSSAQTSAFAQKIDTNCNRYREKWPDGSMKPANGPWARDFFIKNQKDLITQQGALKLYDAEVGDCLRKTSGVGFVNGNLTILDQAKFKTFRISGDVPQCNINTVVFTSSLLKDKHPYNTSDTILETTLHSVGRNTVAGQHAIKQANRNAFDDNQDRVSSELERARGTLQGLSDLSLKNYCGQQFYDKNLRDEFKRLQEKNSACLKKFRADPGSIKADKGCAGWPDQIKSDSAKMRSGVDLLNQNKVLNEFDKGLYSEFANDAAALDQAIADAKKEYTKKSWEYETLRRNQSLLPPENLKGCAKDAREAASVFNEGLCGQDRHPASNLKAFIAENPKVMDTKNRKDLIEDANKRIFAHVIEGSLQTAGSLEMANLTRPATSTAARLARLKSFCKTYGMDPTSRSCTTDTYAKILDSGVKTAAAKRSSHFLAQSDQQAANAIASHFDRIVQACQLPEGPDREQEVRHQTEALYGDQNAGPFALSDTLRSFTQESAIGGCGDAFQLRAMSHPDAELLADVRSAREEFRDLAKEQLQTCANNTLPDFGYHNRGWIERTRNQIGAMECSADLPEKNAMTALYDQFSTYPAILSESVKGLGKQDQQIYSHILCGSMNCHQDIQDGNQRMLDAARMTILAAGIVASGGAAIAVIGAGMTVEAVNATARVSDLSEEKTNLMKGVSSGGYPSSASINDRIREIKSEKRGVIAEAAVAVALESIPAIKEIKHLKNAATVGGLAHGAAAVAEGEATAAAEILSSAPVRRMVAKVMTKIPPKYKAKAFEIVEHKVQHSIKDASGKFMELNNGLVDKEGNLTLEGAAEFGKTLVSKLSYDLIAFDAGTDQKLHEGVPEEKYIDLMTEGMDAYESQITQISEKPGQSRPL